MLDWLTEKFELTRGGNSHNVRPMEGLRGCAVLLVFLVHYTNLVQPWIARDAALSVLVESLRIAGNSGVDLFFVLSGYLIYGSLVSKYQPFAPFVGRRLERIYPTFIAVFVMYVTLSFVLPDESKIPESPGAGALYLLQNFLLLPGLFPIQPMITVAWSLSYEMFYYLALPLLVAVFKLRERSSVWRVTFFLAIAVVFASYTVVNDGPVHLIMFISGILLYEALRNSRMRASSTAGLVGLIAAPLGMLLPIGEPVGSAVKVGIMFVGFFVLCLACFRTPEAWLPKAFSWTPLRWLGNMSYSYYLLHGLVLLGGFMGLEIFMPPTGEQSMVFWWLLAPMLALTLVPSAALFLMIERPFSLAPPTERGASAKLPQAASASESGS